MALHPALTSNTFRGTNPMGWHNSLSGGDARYTTHLVASHQTGQEENCSKDGSPPEQEVISLSGTESCYISSSSTTWWIMRAPYGGPLPTPMSVSCRCYNPSVFALLQVPPGTLVVGRFMRIWVLCFLPTTPEPWLQAMTQRRGQHLHAACRVKIHKILVGKAKSICVYLLYSSISQ